MVWAALMFGWQFTAGVVGVLVLSLGLSGWLLKREYAANATLRTQADQWEQSLAEMAQDYTEQEQRARAAEQEMLASRHAQQRIRNQAAALRRHISDLERVNGDVAGYLSQPMPDALFEQLRAGPGADEDQDDHPAPTGLPAGAAPNADAAGPANARPGAMGHSAGRGAAGIGAGPGATPRLDPGT